MTIVLFIYCTVSLVLIPVLFQKVPFCIISFSDGSLKDTNHCEFIRYCPVSYQDYSPQNLYGNNAIKYL